MRQTVIRIRRQNPDKAVFRSSRRDATGIPEPKAGDDTESVTSSDQDHDENEPTLVDRAYARMIAGGEAELIDFYRVLAQTELFILLDETEGPDPMDLKVIPIEGEEYSLVFDQLSRVDGFAGENAPVSELAGLGLFNLLRGRGIGVAVNMGDTPSTMMIPSDAIDWICDTLEKEIQSDEIPQEPPGETERELRSENSGKFKALMAPRNFPDTLFLMLNEKLARRAGDIDKALVLWAEYQDGQSGFVVAFSGVDKGSRSAVSDAVSQALDAARRNDLVLDIMFLPKDDASLERISRLATPLSLGANKGQKGDMTDLPFVPGSKP